MAEVIDISMPIHPQMVIYPRNPSVVFEQVSEASETTNAITRMTLGTHTGTHLDAPRHVDAAAPGVSAFALDQLIGPVQVVDLTAQASVISAQDLPDTAAERVLLKTRNSQGDVNVFNEQFVALDESAAQEVVRRGIRLIGLDALSIKKRGVRDRVHQILLSAGVAILEGVWLADVAAGDYELLCLPLHVDLDGAPVRAVLRR